MEDMNRDKFAINWQILARVRL